MRGEPFRPEPPSPFPRTPPREPLSPRLRFLMRRKPVTCIIAQKSRNGAVMVADRRALRGYEAREQDKIEVLPSGMVVGISGAGFLADKLLAKLRKLPKRRDFDSALPPIEDIVGTLYKRYRPRFGYSNWEGVSALVMARDRFHSGNPRVAFVMQEGVSEEVNDFEIIGHGAPYATPFIKMLYSNDAGLEQMWRGAFYSISLIEGLELDESVGGLPSVVVLPRGSQPHIMTDEDLEKTEDSNVFDAHLNEWKYYTEWLVRKIAFKTWAVDRLHLSILDSEYHEPKDAFEKMVERLYDERTKEEEAKKATKSKSKGVSG